MRTRLAGLFLLFALVIPVACSKAEPPPKTDFSDEAAGAIAGNNEAFVQAAKAGDAAKLVDGYYADDATLLPPEAPPVEGKAKIREFWDGMMKQGTIIDLKLQTQRIVSSGSIATEVGLLEEVVRMGEKDVTIRGKYAVTHRRQADGTWRAAVDIFSMEPPPPPAPQK